MVMIILGNYNSNYDIAMKTAQWALTPKQLNLLTIIFTKNCNFDNNHYHWSAEKQFFYKVEQFGTFCI